MNTLVRKALDLTTDMSPDRVIADPELNRKFIEHCRSLGLTERPEMLNRSLLNLRKKSGLADRTSRRVPDIEIDEFRFAAEIAVRSMERKHQVSLDEVICDPSLASEFDHLASTIAPGFSSFDYRWAALTLRKASKLRPELMAKVAKPTVIVNLTVATLELGSVPVSQGLYIFFDRVQTLYVGESANLRSRIKKHLEHSDNKELARWLWAKGADGLHLEVQVLEASTTTKVRRALETELIRSRNPLFNVQR